MTDPVYKEYPILLSSKGISARLTDDTAPTDMYLNMNSVEELAENALAQRLGSVINNSTGSIGGAVYPLGGKVVSLYKLGQLGNLAYRYAVDSNGGLWRLSGTSPGQYVKISSNFSGKPCSIQSFCNTDFTSVSTAFFADQNGFFKDTGTQAAPSQGGIFPPQFPVIAQSQEPTTLVQLDDYTSGTAGYSFSGVSGGTNPIYVNTSLSSAVTTPGIQAVTVADVSQPGLFQLLTIDSGANQEIVLVLLVTPTGFVADFTKTHASGASVTSLSLSVTVPASTTATITKPFGGRPIPISETVYGNQSDYIGLYLFVSDPTQVQSITLKFDCGDGSFNSDYFYKVIAQGPLQNLVSTATSSTNPTTALTDALLSDSLNLYGNEAGAIGELNTGLDNWTPLLFQLSDFAGSGRADFTDPFYNWSNVNGYQIQIVTNNNASVTVSLAALVLFGGAGPDTLGGVAYDYVWTFFNPVDGTESNPCPIMTNQNPPNQTNWVYPRRQPVLLNLNLNMFQQGPPGFIKLQDPQATYARIYRRGGTLGDNFRRINEIPINVMAGGTVQYIDTAPDYQIAGAPFVSFTNDVPVPSLLPVPVNTTLNSAITFPGWQIVTPASMANISPGQQVTLGNPTAIQNNFETVVVTSINLNPVTPHQPVSFRAYVQNSHTAGEQVQASINVGQPVFGMVIAFNKAWYWGDPNNPSTLYFSTGNAPQYVGQANNVIVSTPDDYITAVVPYKGNIFVSTIKSGWWMIPPDSPATQPPYPTACKHACVAPFGYVATEEMIAFQAADGLRAFAGGASEYLTQIIEFVFQGVGSTPIVEADQTKLSQTVMAYWNNQIYVSYIGVDGNRHRVIYHMQYKRFRNDDVDAQSLFLEADTNTLVYGDSNGLVHLDRQPIPYDQVNNGGVLAAGPIAINLQTAYNFQESPANQKQYNAIVVDCNTAGQTLSVSALFNDGAITLPLGTINNTQRGKINLPVNAGLGQQAYKISLQITGNVSAFSYLYQAAVEALVLPRTRKTVDTYDMNCGFADSKFCKDFWAQYTATAAINVQVYYDDNPTPGFTFTMPQVGGVRNPLRQRLPSISFRTIRVVAESTGDFIWWQDSCLFVKPQCSNRGYEKVLIVEN
jgi:hypothetical protein